MKVALALAIVMAAMLPAAADAPPNPFGNWRAVEIQGSPVDGVTVTLALGEDGQASGSGGCNRYTGKATVKEGTLTFSPLASTRMACPPAQMDVEAKYHSALQSVAGWRLDSGKLELTSGDGTVLARFAPE